MKPLMTLDEAAAHVPFSKDTLRRAITTTDPHSFPPPLKGKRDSKGRYLVTDRALIAWIDSLPEA